MTPYLQEYFKLELVYAARLRQRREVLGLDAIQDAETDDQSAAGKRAQKALLSGAVARVAFKKAVEVKPGSSPPVWSRYSKHAYAGETDSLTCI
jgi:hypothetical protein